MRFTMKKVFACSLLALSLGFTGCLTDDSGDEDSDTLKITAQPGNVTAAVGDSATISVTATGKGPIKYEWFAVIAGDTIEIEDTTASIKFMVNSYMNAAVLKVIVSNGEALVTSNAATITVTFAAADTLSLGAQGNGPLGSVLDLDSGKVWSSATANANQAQIDLVYLYYNGKATLNGAKAARDSGIAYSINLTNSYSASLVKDIKLVKVTSKPANLSIADSLYNVGPQLRSTATLVENDKFVVLTTEGEYMFVEVRGIAGTTAGSAALSISVGAVLEDEED
jgi:hypothetical protein